MSSNKYDKNHKAINREPLAQTPGPDLACQDAAMESQVFISSENSCMCISRRALRGVGSTSRRPGQADFKKLDLREILLNSQELLSLITAIAPPDPVPVSGRGGRA